MSKKLGELDWSELKKSDEEYNHKPTALWAADKHGGGKEGVDPLNKAEKRLKDGEVPYKPTDEEIANAVMYNAPKQPTDAEMFGHLVVTEDMIKAAEDEWAGKMNKSLTHVDIGDTEEEWGNGESFNKSLSREELEKRNMFTDQ